MSEFWYNGVEISKPEITTIGCAAVYDSADASVMFTRMTYRVKGIVATDQTYSMAENLVYLRQMLLAPRRGLEVVIGDDVINIGDGYAVEAFDDVGGPKPRRCEFTEIIGTRYAYVTYEIEVGLQEGCDNTGSVISHVYTVSHDLDSRFYTTRTVRGTIRVRQTATPPENNADVFRGLAAPALPAGFQRKSMTFLLSADQLQLDYTIQDKELFRVAPPSACEARATFTTQMSNYIWYSHFTMELKGNKQQDQLSMFNDIFKVASSRINFDDATLFIQQASIDEDLYDNVVRFQITVMNAVGKGGEAGLALIPANSQIFTAIPDDGNNQNAVLGPYGYAMLMAAKTAFFSPCVDAPEFEFAQAPATDDTADTTGGSDGAGSDNAPTGSGGLMSQAQQTNPYTKWTQTIEYEQQNGTVLLPSTGGNAGKVYQIHSPYMILKQYGEAVRVGIPVVAPAPQPFYSFQGIVKVKRFTPLAPIPMPDKKTLNYGASWYYEVLIPFGDNDLTAQTQDGQTYEDTKAGTAGYSFPLPGNAAIVFDPQTTNRMQLDAPIAFDVVNTQLPTDGIAQA